MGSGYRGKATRAEALQHAPIEREWLSELDIQAMMGVGPDYIKELKRHGLFPEPSHKVGSEWRWLRDEVKQWMTVLADEIAAARYEEEEKEKEIARRERRRETQREAMRKYMRKRRAELCGA